MAYPHIHLHKMASREEFIAATANSKTLAVFTAPWCGPCRFLEPILGELEADGVKVVRVSTDEEPELSTEFSVTSIPTLFLFIDGRKVAKTVGLQPKSAIQRFIDQA